MANVTFDGLNKRINVVAGVSSINVENDVYSEWKRWSQLSDNSKYLQALRTFGGDPTASGQFAPKYFFLLNGWRLAIDGSTNPNVEAALNLYVEGGGNPFVLSNNATVSNLRSDVTIVDTGGGVVSDQNISDIVDGVTGATEANTQTLLAQTKEILGLSQSNFAMTNQIYTVSGSLETCIIKTYPTAVDVTNDTNPIATYNVNATYDGDGLLTNYTVKKQ